MNDPEGLDETIEARKKAVTLARDAASQGNTIAGMLSEIERLAEPFFLGLETDPDDSDMDVFP